MPPFYYHKGDGHMNALWLMKIVKEHLIFEKSVIGETVFVFNHVGEELFNYESSVMDFRQFDKEVSRIDALAKSAIETEKAIRFPIGMKVVTIDWHNIK